MRHIYIIIAAMAAVLTSCDDHIIEDASWHSWTPGMVYSTNGDVTTYEQCLKKGNKPEAVLFYVDNIDKINGIADTIYVAQGTSADYNAFDGESNTTALRYSAIASPIAKRTDPKYFVPSVAEMYLLYASRNAVNPVIAQCNGTPDALSQRTNTSVLLHAP